MPSPDVESFIPTIAETRPPPPVFVISLTRPESEMLSDVRSSGLATASGTPAVPLPVNVSSCATAVKPVPDPETASIVIVLPATLTVVLAPWAIVTSPVKPFRLVTPEPRSVSLNDISNPEESWLVLASCSPARITAPEPAVTVATSRSLMVLIEDSSA